MCISDYIQSTFFYFERFLKKLADDQCPPITKGSIYHIKHMCIQPFTLGVIDLKFVIKWKYLLCVIVVHTVFLLGMADLQQCQT